MVVHPRLDEVILQVVERQLYSLVADQVGVGVHGSRTPAAFAVRFEGAVKTMKLFDPVGAWLLDRVARELAQPLVADIILRGDLPVTLDLEGSAHDVLTHCLHFADCAAICY